MAETTSDGHPTLLHGKYELGRLLGHGTFAKVYHARNLQSGKSVAMKVVGKEKVIKVGMMEQIKREISVMKMAFLVKMNVAMKIDKVLRVLLYWLKRMYRWRSVKNIRFSSGKENHSGGKELRFTVIPIYRVRICIISVNPNSPYRSGNLYHIMCSEFKKKFAPEKSNDGVHRCTFHRRSVAYSTSHTARACLWHVR
ncbi:hypothetical protein D5086_032289 [Populus alba]|uniref:Uncharacterized protein n=1 Tax=Populus alba TaxID=43335 RepID=A0ACC4AKY1_POPAL